MQLLDRHADRATRRPVTILTAVIGLVATSAKRLLAGSGQDDGADVVIPAGLEKGVEEFHDGARAERIVDFWPIDRDRGDVAGLGVENVLIIHRVTRASLGRPRR